MMTMASCAPIAEAKVRGTRSAQWRDGAFRALPCPERGRAAACGQGATTCHGELGWSVSQNDPKQSRQQDRLPDEQQGCGVTSGWVESLNSCCSALDRPAMPFW